MHKLLLVEDEKNFALVLKDYLKMNDFEVDLCEDGEQGLKIFKACAYDLCIIDIMMPKKDGFSLASEIRLNDKNVPIIFLTARSLRDDVIRGYRIGADDYISKPFDPEVLLFKIKAVLNRRLPFTNEIISEYELGHFKFNYRLRVLKNKKGADVKLSPKEAELLHLLCLHKNDVLPREKALKQIWKEDNYFTARSMDVYIVKLRKYLANDSSMEINNVHGNGYTLKIK